MKLLAKKEFDLKVNNTLSNVGHNIKNNMNTIRIHERIKIIYINIQIYQNLYNIINTT